MDKNRIVACARNAGYPRFHTWSLAEAAFGFLKGIMTPKTSQDTRIQPKTAILILTRLDMLFGKRYNYDLVDPFIAEDFGGVEKIEEIRDSIRSIKALIEEGKLKPARNELKVLSQVLYIHAVEKLVACINGDIELLEGISTRSKLKKLDSMTKEVTS